MFRRTNKVNRRQQKVSGLGKRVETQRVTINKLDANRSNLNRVAKEIAVTRERIAEFQRTYAQLRTNYEKRYVQYKKNARRVLGNNRTVMARLGSSAQKILATRQKNMNKKNTALHNNTQKAIGPNAAGVAPRVSVNMGSQTQTNNNGKLRRNNTARA
jgi:hypothetical protein